MRIYDRLINAGWLSRRRMIVGGAAGLLAATATPPVQATTAAMVSDGGTAEDYLAIEQLIYRYGMALDSLDNAALEGCFAPGVFSSALVDRVIEYHRTYAHTMHQVLNHVHTVRGRAATGITYCIASMVKSHADKLTKFDVYFMYRDELVKQGDRWLFSKMRALEVVFSTDEAPVQPGAPLLGPSVKPGSFRARPALDQSKP